MFPLRLWPSECLRAELQSSSRGSGLYCHETCLSLKVCSVCRCQNRHTSSTRQKLLWRYTGHGGHLWRSRLARKGFRGVHACSCSLLVQVETWPGSKADILKEASGLDGFVYRILLDLFDPHGSHRKNGYEPVMSCENENITQDVLTISTKDLTTCWSPSESLDL